MYTNSWHYVIRYQDRFVSFFTTKIKGKGGKSSNENKMKKKSKGRKKQNKKICVCTTLRLTGSLSLNSFERRGCEKAFRESSDDPPDDRRPMILYDPRRSFLLHLKPSQTSWNFVQMFNRNVNRKHSTSLFLLSTHTHSYKYVHSYSRIYIGK